MNRTVLDRYDVTIGSTAFIRLIALRIPLFLNTRLVVEPPVALITAEAGSPAAVTMKNASTKGVNKILRNYHPALRLSRSALPLLGVFEWVSILWR